MRSILFLLFVTLALGNTWARTRYDANSVGFKINPTTRIAHPPHLFTTSVLEGDCRTLCESDTRCNFIKWWTFNGVMTCTGFANWADAVPTLNSHTDTLGNLHTLTRA
eukprot:NODE_1994_length_790_cov_95.866397_g1585_i0.p2 GENE.NODE_1994_length_790_cov_95.866397_g1585_i0~~NODE_1994_length_790_cov_95.866397_g1585_i0.p2  ORF type:complete len:127 (+),score=38.77 NODE_1994_length_790_cov_95.866397_g1585_i0:58-381(+)